ncbi:MAG: AAA family ATPase [Anaerolineae bacterium]|nr:AAA family ATPase [Anaerolineae bacterium]
MEFKFHLYVQRHHNRTYTVVPLPFYDMTVYGINLEELKSDLAEALTERIKDIAPQHLHHLEFDSGLSLHKIQVEVRPLDRKTRKKRREQVRLMFSVLVTKEEDGQLLVTVPKVGNPPLTFYVYQWDELQPTGATELTAWLDGLALDQLLDYQHARSETLDTLEIDVPVRKAKNAASGERGGPFDDEPRFWALRETGINMTAQASEGRFRKTYRRDEVVESILQTLAAPRNNCVLITGPSEVGKTAVVHEVVRRIQRKDGGHSVLKDREVWMLTPDRLIAGAQYIGTWEERLKDIVAEARQNQHILFVEDLPGLIEIGRWSKSDQNVAQALKPHIESGEIVLFGEANEDRLRMGEAMASGFVNLFRRVRLEPLSEDETLSVLGYVARDLERELSLRIEPSAVEAVVELTRRFLPYRSFPGKAVRLLESTAADAKKQHVGFLRPSVRRDQVIDTFARQTGLPEFIVADNVRLNAEEVEQYFQERILGQDEAVRGMVDLVLTVKAGLNDPAKPLGTFFFIGPTGVGKTQMAKALASYLFGDEARLIRFDMSEYVGADGVARLIGAFNSEGELTTKVREQPFCVLLLDEFEKADPRIYDMMLQVFGEGRLTDAAGRTTYFHNAIIIMTSNLGAEQRALRSPGFVQEIDDGADFEAMGQHYRERIVEYFRPEFVNRIDRIVIFGKLNRQALRQIASRELGEILLRDGITRRNVVVEIDESVIELVLEKGYSPVYGARPLKREIERLVVAPMARALAQRNPDEQHLLRILGEDGAITLKNIPIDEATQRTDAVLNSALDSRDTRRVKLDGPGLVESFAELRRDLADWDDSDTLKEMRDQKDRMLTATTEPDFWEDGDRARDTLTRFYFLDRLVRRLKQLRDRAEYLEDFAVLVNRERDARYQAELVGDFEELYRNVSYLNIELLTAHLPHRNQAMMLITALGMPSLPDKPHEAWPRQLSEMYLRWAERKGYDRDLYLLTPDADVPGGAQFVQVTAGSFRDMLKRYARYDHASEIAIFAQGANVFGFLKGERGIHKLLGKDVTGEDHARVQVFAIPDGTDVKEWLADYQRIKTDIAEGRQSQPPQEKHYVIRVYSLDRGEKFVRDQRTGLRQTNIKDVMQRGKIDEFILAFLRSEEAQVGWEDRYPPTFPF